MRAAIVGYSAAGKSSLFQLLTGAKPDPSARNGQLGVALLHDPRIPQLARLYATSKVTATSAEIVDTPGLDPRGGAENRRVLGLVRDSHALVVVLGAYLGNDPVQEWSRLRDEFLLADLAIVEGRVERVRESLRKPLPNKELLEDELTVLEKLAATLGAGQLAAQAQLAPSESERVKSLALISEKPHLLVINPTEEKTDTAPPADLPEALIAFPRLELELQAIEGEERAAFLQDFGNPPMIRDALVERLHHGLLKQIQFFTAGPKEVHAWSVAAGSDALTAAARIHTDLARGFIRAEVIPCAALLAAGSEAEAKRLGHQRVEGKGYGVQDGDVLVIRFSV